MTNRQHKINQHKIEGSTSCAIDKSQATVGSQPMTEQTPPYTRAGKFTMRTEVIANLNIKPPNYGHGCGKGRGRVRLTPTPQQLQDATKDDPATRAKLNIPFSTPALSRKGPRKGHTKANRDPYDRFGNLKVTPLAASKRLPVFSRPKCNFHHTPSPSILRSNSKEFGKKNTKFDFPMSCWMIRALPPLNRTRILTAAAIVGARTNGRLVKLGQVSYITSDCQARQLRFSIDELDQLMCFAKEASLSDQHSAIRTAIAIGLGLPGALDGIISPPSAGFVVTTAHCNRLLIEANVLTKQEHRALRKATKEGQLPPVIVEQLTIHAQGIIPSDQVIRSHRRTPKGYDALMTSVGGRKRIPWYENPRYHGPRD